MVQATTIHINSANRGSNYTSASNFTIPLKETIRNIRRVTVQNLSIPYSFYLVTANNYALQWISGVTTYNAVIPVGNYSNAAALAAAIQTAMNAAHANSYVVTVSSTSLKMTITGTAAFQMQVTSSKRLTGYTATTASATTQAAPSVVDVAGSRYVMVQCEELSFCQSYSNLQDSTPAPAFYKLDVNVVPGGIAYLNRQLFPLYTGLSGVNLGKLTFQIYDDDGFLIDLNGSNWSISVLLEYD